MMRGRFSPHSVAVFQAVFVTFLWATSWVLIKIGLGEIPALTFAGLRYFLAFLMLLPLLARGGRWSVVRSLTRREWLVLVALGLVYYTATQGAQFVALGTLPAVTLSLMLNFTAVLVALLGMIFLQERVRRRQWLGMAVFLVGMLVYFYPVAIPEAQVFGLVVGVVAVVANSISAVMGRAVNRNEAMPPLVATVISMGIGSVVLLAGGVLVEGLPTLGLDDWLLLLYMGLFNTALAFTLWNHTLRVLSAVESSVINNTILAQIALLAWVFLGETITLGQLAALGVAVVGILLVQLRGSRE